MWWTNLKYWQKSGIIFGIIYLIAGFIVGLLVFGIGELGEGTFVLFYFLFPSIYLMYVIASFKEIGFFTLIFIAFIMNILLFIILGMGCGRLIDKADVEEIKKNL